MSGPSAGRPPLSALQRALYLVELLRPGTPTYNLGVALRIRGPLDVPRLASAITRVVAAHDALRTTVVAGDAPPFEPALRVLGPDAAAGVCRLDVVDLDDTAPDAQVDTVAAALRAAQELVDEPFDLAAGPLLRTRLWTVGRNDHLLAITMHHLVSDGPSMQVFADDLAAGYDDPSAVTAPAVRFSDYAAGQRDRPADDAGLGWWRAHLAGVPTVLRLPTDHPPPAVAGTHGGHHRRVLGADGMDRVRRLARDLRVTPFAVTLSVYAVLLGRLADVGRVLVGVPVGARDRVELERVIGYFATTLPVLVELGEQSVAALCRSVQEELLDVVDHSDVTLEQLVRELAPRREAASAPLVQTYFALEQDPVVDARLGALSVTPADLLPTAAKVDLELTLQRAPGAAGQAGQADQVDLTLTYRTDLYEPSTAARLADGYERLLVAAVASPETGIGALPAIEVPAALPAAAPGGPAPEPVSPPAPGPAPVDRDRLREQLLQIWREVLGRDDVGATDNFFDAGGTSFALTTVHALLVARTGSTVPLVSLLEFPTVEALVDHLGGARQAPPPDTPPDPGRTTRLRDRRERLRRARTGGGSAR